jgi:hypothetical protein
VPDPLTPRPRHREPGASSRNLKLTAADWGRLEAIARREGLEWGGVASRSDAVRWLIARDAERPKA